MLKPEKHEGVKHRPFYKTSFSESGVNLAKHEDPNRSYNTTKKNWERDNAIFKGGNSEERDEFYFGKRTFQQKKDLYKTKFAVD